MARPGKDAGDDAPALPSEIVTKTLTGYRLKKNFGYQDFQHARHWSAGTVFRVGQHDAEITLLHRHGAVLEPVYE